ncbi:hypothetical protein C8R45DRAFT_1096823 [Mycena sanguinolenta]|nr:hypothetical protein C8R45DRAFT_1096823 [Mycena sanguinolenta]
MTEHPPTTGSAGRNPQRAGPKSYHEQSIERRAESHRAASARYRQKHYEEVREADRLRAAARRACLHDDEGAHARAREHSARYRQRHREELVRKQRKARAQAFVEAFVQRRRS